jgi:hypothetical protein
MLAFTAMPVGPDRSQLTMFPEDSQKLIDNAAQIGITLDGPHHALLVQGDDELGALAEIHKKLYDAEVSVYSSSGVTDGDGSFGYILYIRPEDYKSAVSTLGI